MTARTPNGPQSLASKANSHITNTELRTCTKLRTIDELAELWKVSHRTVQRLIKSGALRAHRIGRLVRISDADVTDYLHENRDV